LPVSSPGGPPVRLGAGRRPGSTAIVRSTQGRTLRWRGAPLLGRIVRDSRSDLHLAAACRGRRPAHRHAAAGPAARAARSTPPAPGCGTARRAGSAAGAPLRRPAGRWAERARGSRPGAEPLQKRGSSAASASAAVPGLVDLVAGRAPSASRHPARGRARRPRAWRRAAAGSWPHPRPSRGRSGRRAPSAAARGAPRGCRPRHRASRRRCRRPGSRDDGRPAAGAR